MTCSLLRNMCGIPSIYSTLAIVGLIVTLSAVLAEDETSLRASGHMYDIYKKRLANLPKYDYEMKQLDERSNKQIAENDMKLQKWNNVLAELQQKQNNYLVKLREEVSDGSKRSIATESLYDKFKQRLNNEINGLMDDSISNKVSSNSNGNLNIDYIQRPERGFFNFYKKKTTKDVADKTTDNISSSDKDKTDNNSVSTAENVKALSKTDGVNSVKSNSSEKFHKTDTTTEGNYAVKRRLFIEDKDRSVLRHKMKRNTPTNSYRFNKMMAWEDNGGGHGYDYERNLIDNNLQDPRNYFIWQKNDKEDIINDYSIERFINQCKMERYPGKPLKVIKRDIKNLNAINNADHCEIKKAVEQTLPFNINKYSLYPRILETPPPSYNHYIPNNGSRILKQYAEQMNTTTLQAAKHVLSMNTTELGNQLKLMQQQQHTNLNSNTTNSSNDSLELECKRNTKQTKSIMQHGIPSVSLQRNQCTADYTNSKQSTIDVYNKTAIL